MIDDSTPDGLADTDTDADPEADSQAQLREDLLREARQAARRERAWHEARTERLKVYAILLRATLPRIGASARLELGPAIEIDPDLTTARNLAMEAIFADIRRIAGAGPLLHPEADDRA
jgi:hypothetical protein